MVVEHRVIYKKRECKHLLHVLNKHGNQAEGCTQRSDEIDRDRMTVSVVDLTVFASYNFFLIVPNCSIQADQ